MGKGAQSGSVLRFGSPRYYAACVSFADAQVGRLLAALEENGLVDDTIVLLWGTMDGTWENIWESMRF